MDKNLPIGVLIVLVIAVLALQIVALTRPNNAVPAQNTTQNRESLGYIKVTARGSASAKPERVDLGIELGGRGATAYAATANLSSELSQANTILMRYVEGNESRIKTTGYYLYNQSSYYYGGYIGYNGYKAQEFLSVEIPNVTNASAAAGELSRINGISIGSMEGVLSDSQKSNLTNTALSNALANATERARILLPGKNLSEENITVNGYYGGPILPLVAGAAEAGSAVNATPTSAYFGGVDTVTESVTVVFSYKR